MCLHDISIHTNFHHFEDILHLMKKIRLQNVDILEKFLKDYVEI